MHRAVLYEFPADNTDIARITHRTTNGDVTIVLVSDLADVPVIALDLVEAGFELIELCGGMPMAVRARVRAAVPRETRVASISFGIESVGMAADFNRAFMAGNPPAEGCIILAQGADPAADRFIRKAAPQQVTFVMSDDRDAVDAARDLVEQGTGLIELYGGFSDETAAAIIEVATGRAAVGLSSLGHECAPSLAGEQT